MRLNSYFRLMRFDKPIGMLLLLWPTLWALWLSNHGHPDFIILTIFIIGTVVMRAAGCVINDIADRNFDGGVERTCNRPLATGELSLNQAVFTFLALMGIAVVLLFFLKVNIFLMAAIGAGLAIIYPFCKRFLPTPQMVLGIAFSWGIPLAFLSSNQPLTNSTWLLMLINFLWVISYDTYYALVDKEDDLKLGIHSTAIYFGAWGLKLIMLFQFATSILWLLVAQLNQLGFWFYFFWTLANLFFIYQNVIVKNNQRKLFFKAFLNNNWYGFTMFIAILLGLSPNG